MDSANLWAPWRLDYLRSLPDAPATDGPGCFLCDAIRLGATDDRSLVLHANESAVLMMNRYPYTTGHVMVAPTRHAGDLTDLTPHERAALMEMTVTAERLVQKTLNPQGMNIGINIGRAAGAGLPGHLHVHLVPRWGGDTNFIHVVAGVRVIPQALEETYRELKSALGALGV